MENAAESDKPVLAYGCMRRKAIQEGRFAIEAVQPAHVESIRQWRNAQMDVLRQSSPISQAQQVAYYREQIWPELASPEPRNILLAFRRAGTLIGYGGLVHIAWAHRRAEVSFLLQPELAERGAEYEECFYAFLNLIKRLAFEDLGIERLFTETYAMRNRHIGVLENSGFDREGILRRHVRIDGRPFDSIIHGCLRPSGE